MEDALENGLLPEGLRDGLPPKAHERELVVRTLQDCFDANGYALVAPPLVEFEAGLRGRLDSGQGDSSDAFRLLDPVSQKTLLVRSDITRQVARIATTRMLDEPRPLRLAYTGSALRTRGTQLRPSRQVRQVGFELIGASGPVAARELAQVVMMGYDALGLEQLTFDLSFPGFIPALCADLSLSGPQSDQVKAALDDKDAAALATLPSAAQRLFQPLLNAVGSPSQVIKCIAALDLPEKAAAKWADSIKLIDVFAEIVGPDRLHVDPGEVHGFSYQAGWALSVFADGVRGELGKGGAYVLGSAGNMEAAQGFTFYPDVFADRSTMSEPRKRVCVEGMISLPDARDLQSRGYALVRALDDEQNLQDQAIKMGCHAIFANGTLTLLASSA